jgi:hypothetical protein
MPILNGISTSTNTTIRGVQQQADLCTLNVPLFAESHRLLSRGSSFSSEMQEKAQTVFSQVDTSGSGTIAKDEVQYAFFEMGILISDEVAEKFTKSSGARVTLYDFTSYLEDYTYNFSGDSSDSWFNKVATTAKLFTKRMERNMQSSECGACMLSETVIVPLKEESLPSLREK